MDQENWQPDVVIGVNFGMTCTGVAYSSGPDWHDPKVVQNWPGLSGSELRNKVPSVLAYTNGSGIVESWGFLADVEAADTEAPDVDIYELFKLNLDPAYQDKSQRPISTAQARICFRDYLRQVRRYTEQRLEDSIPEFAAKNVEYVFSTPTTWTSPAMIHQIETALRDAGFSDGDRRKFKMGLTEAEAAAVYASKRHGAGDVILICDAGGGTTDVNILKVKGVRQKHTELDRLVCVEGQSVGSAMIDWKVRQLITQRLQSVQNQLTRDPEDCASLMLHNRFETFKCSFGKAGSNAPSFPMQIPSLPADVSVPEAGISGSRMYLTRDELRKIFDDQVDRIFGLMQEQMSRLMETHPFETIRYMVLSGGLGSSPYVKARLQNRSDQELGRMRCAQNMEFLTVQDPQVAVVLGLVSDRIQELNSGDRVFKERCARNSYGVLVRELYKPLEHMGEDVNKDPRDGKLWAEGQIHWLIKKGQTISTERYIEQSYMLKRNLGSEKGVWRTDIVVSDRPKDQLPRSLKRPGAKILCNLTSSLDERNMKRKNRHWYNFGPEYCRAEITMRVLVNPADLKFQIWDQDSQRVSRDYDQIQVRWDPPGKNHGVDGVQEREGLHKI